MAAASGICASENQQRVGVLTDSLNSLQSSPRASLARAPQRTRRCSPRISTTSITHTVSGPEAVVHATMAPTTANARAPAAASHLMGRATVIAEPPR
jgi:hypothetical protein